MTPPPPLHDADRRPGPPCEGAPETARQAPLSSDSLLRGRRLVEITHNGEVYRLQATRLGKLILTK